MSVTTAQPTSSPFRFTRSRIPPGQRPSVGFRDAATLNDLNPTDGRWPGGIRLRVKRNGEDVGWAVVTDNQLEDDPRFGDLRVGCVADSLAAPEDAAVVVGAATRFLESRGVDVIGSNQSHPDWIAGFAAAGYVILDRRRFFAVSPEFQKVLAPFEETARGLHMLSLIHI